jgi:hypothetical protein
LARWVVSLRRRVVPRYRLADLLDLNHPDLALFAISPWLTLAIDCPPPGGVVSEILAAGVRGPFLITGPDRG